MRLQQPSTLVFATPASALVFGGDTEPPASAYDVRDEAGEQALHLPSLAVPRDKRFKYDLNGDNCMARWARIPANHKGPVDVVIHFHGFSGRNAMKLADKAAASGIDLRTPGVGGPTLGLVPHGVPFEWFDGKSKERLGDGFRFPQLASRAQLDAFVEEALKTFSKLHGGTLSCGRLVLTCHSGGGAALSKLLATLKDHPQLRGCEYFDATYGGEDVLTAADGWVARAIERDAKALAQVNGEDSRRRYLQAAGSHLRIVFLDGTGTASVAIATEAFLKDRLAQVTSEDVRALLRKHYRAQKVADPKKVYHGKVPSACGGRLLADAGHDLSPDTRDLPAPVGARAHAYEEWDDQGVDSEAAEALDWDTEAQDVTMPQKKVTRPADAPTGSAFIASLGDKKGVERENRIFEQLKAGNIPPSLLIFQTVRLSGKDKAGTSHDFEYYVTPDVLAVGSESDSVRVPVDPVTAQRIADFFDCLLPTARMVEQIYQAAPTKLAFIPGHYAGTARDKLQDASSEYLTHSRKIDAQLRRPPTILTAGHKKELVISNGYIKPRTNKETGVTKPAPMLAFYGGHTAAGVPIQAPGVKEGRPMRGWPSFAHGPSFVDYSHGVRLVWPTMKVDGTKRDVAEVLKDPQLCPLIVAEGPIPNPRYTLDRAGKPATAKAQALESEDPLALGTWDVAGALGYGSTWDASIRSAVEGFLAGWKAIPVKVGAQTVNVHPPYYINVNDKSGAASKERAKLAEQHRAAAPAALRSLINEKRFLNARIGKATREDIRTLLEAADAKGVLLTDSVVGGSATPEKLRAFLQHYGLGVDCSGFVAQAINELVALFKDATAADRIAAPHSTNSAALKGGQGAFEKVTDPTQLCGGDTMWLSGHIRILAYAERKGDRIVFCTAESRSSNPKDIGPAAALWRLVPDAKAGSANFKGWRLERSKDLGATDGGWQSVATTHVYGHYKPLRKLVQAAGGKVVALADDEAWALQAPQPYLPAGGRAFVPRQGTFNTAPAAFTVVPASFLPEPTTNTTAAIDAALTAAGLDATQRGQVSRPGLVPIAAAFGSAALGELFARLRWAPDFIVRKGNGPDTMLVQRLLLHIPGHFRELARRAPSAAEAFVLECLGWAMLSHVRDAIANATRTRWWIPPAPDFVTAVPNPMPAVSAEVRQVITRLGFIDTVMPVGNWNARYASWRRGLAGRQWDSEVNGTTPGLPLYAGLLSVPAHVNTATQRAAFTTAWNARVAAVDAAHPPMAAGAAQVTLSGLLNAATLRQDAPANIPPGHLGNVDLQGVELVRGDFPLVDGGPVSRRFTMLRQIHPVVTALFSAIRELGWNDLIYQNSGAIAFRGVKHDATPVTAAGASLGAPFSAPTAALVTAINNNATPASRAAVVSAARAARSMSNHAMGIAIDINYPENVNSVRARPFGSMDPRVVALLEAFHFQWGAGFRPTDPHHFDYCQNPCAPAAVAGRPAPAAGALPGMIPNFPAPGGKGSKGGTAVA